MFLKISSFLIYVTLCQFQFVITSQKYEFISDCFFYDRSATPGFDNLTYICSCDGNNKIFLDTNAIKCSNLPTSLDYKYPGTIDFRNCQFTEMPKIKFFEWFYNMHTFIISNVDLEKISSDTFRQATNIKNLIVSQNRLEEIPPLAFVNVQKLQNLDFSNNSIKRIDWLAFVGLNNLVSLDLSHNNLTKFDEKVFKELVNLKFLNLSYNQINELELKVLAFPNLLELDLAHNNLTGLNGDVFSQLGNLKQLNLSFNPIGELKQGIFLHLINLEHLNLRQINISSIARSTFSHQQNLISLDLSDNLLKTMDFNLFLPSLPDLTSLRLASNQLSELFHFHNSLFPQLQYFNIQNNNFNCSYLEHFMGSVNWEKLRMPIDLNLVDFDGPNIRGVNCEEIDYTNKSTPYLTVTS